MNRGIDQHIQTGEGLDTAVASTAAPAEPVGTPPESIASEPNALGSDATRPVVAAGLPKDLPKEPAHPRLPVYRGGRTGLLTPTGPLNADTARALLDQIRSLTAAACRSLILDLRRVDYVDSQGARTLLALRDAVAEAGGRLRLVITEGSPVERTLRLLRFETLFPTFRRVADAWKSKDEPRSPRGPLTRHGSTAR